MDACYRFTLFSDSADEFGQAVSVAGQFAVALVAEVVREMVLGFGVVGNAPQTVEDNVFALTGDFDAIVVTTPQAVAVELQRSDRSTPELQRHRESPLPSNLVVEARDCFHLSTDVTNQIEIVYRKI